MAEAVFTICREALGVIVSVTVAGLAVHIASAATAAAAMPDRDNVLIVSMCRSFSNVLCALR
jgi:hypothetical protein